MLLASGTPLSTHNGSCRGCSPDCLLHRTTARLKSTLGTPLTAVYLWGIIRRYKCRCLGLADAKLESAALLTNEAVIGRVQLSLRPVCQDIRAAGKMRGPRNTGFMSEFRIAGGFWPCGQPNLGSAEVLVLWGTVCRFMFEAK